MLRATLLIGCVLVPSLVMGQESVRDSDDEQAVRQCVEAYVAAFNQGDAEALAQMWSDEGVWVSPDGIRLSGRAAIQEAMARYFAESQDRTLSLSNTSFRLIAPTVAVEEGSARVLQSGEPPADTTYIAIHVKTDGQWRLDSVRETSVPVPSGNYEYLKPLEWLVGTWVDQDEESTVEMTCAWTKNKNFMTRSFRVQIKDRIELEGTQVIGYDAVNGEIRSWVFDTDGGIAEGTWHQDGDRWIVKHTHRTAAGQLGSAMTIVRPLDDNSYEMQATGREMDGQILPDIDPVVVVRK